MDEFHDRLTRIALDAVGRYGFCLAGGYAIQAHGFLERRSEDVDLFAPANTEERFAEAVRTLTSALRANGLTATMATQGATFARLNVIDEHDGNQARMELGIDWRSHPPTHLEIGPVLHADDAVANKACALFGRAEVRDYVDVDAILQSGRYTVARLVELAMEHDPGFDPEHFAEALSAIRRLPSSAFDHYGFSRVQHDALVARVLTYADQVQTS